MSRLDELAPLATMGVGSLPFDDLDVAVRHGLRAYDVPFCPQLPSRDGGMVAENQFPAAWYRFFDEVGAAPRRPSLVKLQVTGPYTLAMAEIQDADPTAVVRRARELSEMVAHTVSARIDALRQLDIGVLLIVDEPGIGHADIAGDVTPWDALRTCGASAWGLHICGLVPWDDVLAASPDVLSFDAVTQPPTDDALAALRQLVASGTRIAWGVVDPVAPDPVELVADRIAGCLAAIDSDIAADRSLVTPTCGTGRLTERDELLVAAVLSAAAGIVIDGLAPNPSGLS